MGFVPFFFPSTFPLDFARIWLDAKSVRQKCALKKIEKLQNEAFSGPSEMCVFQLLFAPPPLTRSGLPVIHSLLHVPCLSAPTHPHCGNFLSGGGREGGGEHQKHS